MSTEETIVEEVQENEEVKTGKNNFSRKMGDALRRSKRIFGSKRKSFKSSNSAEKENVSPPSLPTPPTLGVSKDDVQVDATDMTDNNEEVSPRRKQSQTFFSSEKQIEIDGRKIKEIEVVGEKSTEPIDMKKQKKLVRKKSLDQSELNIACRDLGKADFEGWLQKKAGGHGIIPVSWKRYWCVVKAGKLYCYKTSFDIAADYAIPITCYAVEKTTEKKKMVFKMTPKTEDFKLAVFAGDTEEDVNAWVEIINKVLSGVDISKSIDHDVPEYEERHRMYSASTRVKDDPSQSNVRHKQRLTSAFSVDTETTAMPAGFGARTQSNVQPRIRKMSAGATKPESCLAVGSMFKPLDVDEEGSGTPQEDADVNTLLYKEVEVVTITTDANADQTKGTEIAKLNAEIAKLKDDMFVLNKEEERKSTELPLVGEKEVVVPTIEVEETGETESETVIPVKSEIDEETFHINIRDHKSGQERTTSQIFRDFEAATEADQVVAHVEEEKDENAPTVTVSKLEELPYDTDVEQLVEPKEKPPRVEEEELIETRKSLEIDAETVITELEAQHKKQEEEAALAKKEVDVLLVSDAEESIPNPSHAPYSGNNEVVVTDIIVTLVPEEDAEHEKNEAQEAEDISEEDRSALAAEEEVKTEAVQLEDVQQAHEIVEVESEIQETIKEVPAEEEIKPDEPKSVEAYETIQKESDSAAQDTPVDMIAEDSTFESEKEKIEEQHKVDATEKPEEKQEPAEFSEVTVEKLSEDNIQSEAAQEPSEVAIETTIEIIVADTIVAEENELNNETKRKPCSVYLGEDLDIPVLNLGEKSLSDEINIQLSSSVGAKKSFTVENIMEEIPQMNGDASHIISVN